MCVIHRHRLIDPDGDTFADLEQLLDRRVDARTSVILLEHHHAVTAHADGTSDDDTPADRPLHPSAASTSAAHVHT